MFSFRVTSTHNFQLSLYLHLGIVNVNVEETADGRIALRAFPTKSCEDIGKTVASDDTKVDIET